MIASVRARLTLWYAVVLAVVLVTYTGGAYAFLVHRVYSEMDHTLRADFEAAEALTREGGEAVRHGAHAPKRWVEVRDATGTLIAREGPGPPLPDTAEGTASHTIAGEHVRVLTGKYEGATIRVARSESHVRQRLGEFLLVMGIALPLALALACAAGYVLARRALAPVDRIVEHARGITADRLTERLPVENPNDELGRLATTFNETFARLQRSFEEMKRFTGDAAHELRTPLTVLRSVGEVCLRDPDADAREAIGSMLEEVGRMTRLVDGLLRLARADGAAAAASLQPVDLGQFARALVERLGIAARVDADEAVMVNADPDLLSQALGNVLDNAVRHSPDHVEVRVRAPGIVEVIDQGCGIAPEHIERIFERFYRADEARARDTGGAGLGLAIARWAIEAQGGHIEVESRPGEGATFRISLVVTVDPPMKIERMTAGNVTILAFTGEFDRFNLPTISEKIDALIQTGCTKLVFNLRLLKFINSSALGYLIKTHKRLRELEGELVLSEPSTFFQTTIKTLGIDQIFKIYPDDNEALKYLQDAGGEQAKEFEDVPIDEKLLGSTTVFFRLLDAPEAMAVGKILSLYEDGPTFKYPADPDKVEIDPDELIIGRSLWIKFRQPFLEKERFFEMEAEIVMAVDLDDFDGAAKFRLRYTKIDPEDKTLLEKFVRDRDDRGGDGGSAGVFARLHPRRPSGSGEASPPREEGTA